MGRRGPTSRFDLDELRQLVADGMYVAQIARKLHCSRSTVYYLARQAGVRVPPAPRRVDRARREQWAGAILDAPNLTVAAETMGKTRQAASKMAKRLEEDGEIEFVREDGPAE